MRPDPEVSLNLTQDLIRELQESAQSFKAAWKAGQKPTIESYLGSRAGAPRSLLLKELLRLDVYYRRQSGEAPRAAEYLARFPEAADLIAGLSESGDTKSLVGDSASETAAPQSVKPVIGDRSIEATRTAVRGKEDRDGPQAAAVDDRSKANVSLVEFVRALTDSGLMSQDELDTFLGGLPADNRPDNGKQLAQELHRCKKLTRFQVQAVYQGKTRGLVVGNYVVLGKLGEGGMGQVYKARHKRMDRVVALKVLPPHLMKSADAIKRFHREAKAAAKLSHPNIVTAYDANDADGVHFLVMEYVDGQDLSNYVKEKGALSIQRAVECVVQAARGLEYAHQQGIIHRDIKPHNLLLDRTGTVRILDMGLAQIGSVSESDQASLSEGLTHSGQVMGTLDYMSPEQALDTKTVDGRADIYSLGCTLFYLLAGRPPYEGDTIGKLIVAHQMAPIPVLRALRPTIPPALDKICQHMLAKKAVERPQSMAQVIAELESFLAGEDLHDPGLGPLDAIQVGGGLDETQAGSSSSDPFGDLLPDGLSFESPLPAIEKNGKPRGPKWGKPLYLAGGVGACAMVVILLLSAAWFLRAKSGTLVVSITEPNATVQVLDSARAVEVSATSVPGTMTFSVEPGSHRLQVLKEGFQSFTQDFVMESRGHLPLAVNLLPMASTGTLDVKLNDADVLLEISHPDGRVMATYRNASGSVAIPLPPGTYRLLVEKAGFEKFNGDVRVDGGKTVKAEVKLAAIPPPPPAPVAAPPVVSPPTITPPVVALPPQPAKPQPKPEVTPPKPQRGKLTVGSVQLKDVPPTVFAKMKDTFGDGTKVPDSKRTTILGRITLGDGRPVKLRKEVRLDSIKDRRDVTVALVGSGVHFIDVFEGGWFANSISDLRKPQVTVLMEAFSYHPLECNIPIRAGEISTFEVQMEPVAEQDWSVLHLKSLDAMGAAIPQAEVRICTQSFGVLRLKTDSAGNCTARVPPGAEYVVSGDLAGYLNDFKDVKPDPGATENIELMMYADRNYLVKLEYVFQTDGSRGFSGPGVQLGNRELSLTRLPENFIYGANVPNELRFMLSDDKRDPREYDLRARQEQNGVTFDSAYGHGHQCGFIDLGPVEFDAVLEAPEKDYSKERESACNLSHVYVMKTLEGRFVKFVVHSITPRSSLRTVPAQPSPQSPRQQR